jgi:hypothetical protein
MSARCGPLLVAIASVLVRLSGNAAVADALAMTYLATLTFCLSRASDLQTTARAYSRHRIDSTHVQTGAYSPAN